MDYLSHDILQSVQYPRSFMQRILAHYDASNTASIDRAFVATTGTVTGTSGTASLTTSSDLTGLVYLGDSIQANGVDNYIVSTINATTITTTTNLVNTYIASSIAIERCTNVRDLGPRGNILTNGTATSRLKYVPGGTNAINNMPCFGCLGQSTSSGSNNSGHGVNGTLFAVMMTPTDPLTNVNIFGKTSGEGQLAFNGAQSAYHLITASSGNSINTINSAYTNGTPFLISGITDNDRNVVEVNNVSIDLAFVGLGFAVTGTGLNVTLGSTSSGKHQKTGECIWIDGTLSGYEYAHIRNLLKVKWGVAG